MKTLADIDELNRVLAAARAAGATTTAEALQRAIMRWDAPMRVRVLGRAGVGKSAVVAVLDLPADSESEPIDAIDSESPVQDGDIYIYVLAGARQSVDDDVITSLPSSHTLVVHNKVDTVDTLTADALPMIATLGRAVQQHRLSNTELDVLRILAASTDPTLTLSAELFLAAEVAADAGTRRALLDRWQLAGIRVALRALAESPNLSADELWQQLAAAAGVRPVRTALTTRITTAHAARERRLRDELERIAARASAATGGTAALIEELVGAGRW